MLTDRNDHATRSRRASTRRCGSRRRPTRHWSRWPAFRRWAASSSWTWTSTPSAMRGVSNTLRRAPWAPLLVVTRASANDPEVLRELEGVPGSPAFLVRRPEEGSALASLAQHAVCSRRPADPEMVAAYVASRLRRPSISHADDHRHVRTRRAGSRGLLSGCAGSRDGSTRWATSTHRSGEMSSTWPPVPGTCA